MEITPEQFNNLATKDDLREIEERLVTKAEFYEFKEEFYELKGEVNVLKDDVAVLKIDVAVLKTDVAEFKGEFRDFKEEVTEKMDVIIGMLEKSSKDEKDHEMEHVANIKAHDRFQGEIDQIKTQIKSPASV